MPFVGDELYKYIRERMPSFLLVNVTELLPHLSCLTQMDQERVRAQVRMEGNESAVPTLLDSLRRRRNWERQLVNALHRNEYHDLADGLENKLESLAPQRQSPSGGTSAPFRKNATADNSPATHFVSPPRSQFSVSLPDHHPHIVVVSDNRLSSSDIIPPAVYLQPNVTGLQPTVHSQQSASGTPSPSAPVPQSVPGTPIPNTPAAQSTPLPQSVPGTPILNAPVESTTVPQSVPDIQTPNTPAQCTPVPHTTPRTAIPGTPVAQSTPSTTAPGTHVPPQSDLPATVSNTSGESSSAPLRLSDSSLQDNSTECKLPVQEMGNPLDREESKDHRLPIQEKMVLPDLSKSSDFPQGQQNQTKHSNQGNTGEKCNVRSTNQAKGGIISDEAIVTAPPPSIQLHPPRPSQETSLPVIDKPGVLVSNVGSNELATESTCDLPEGGCSITSSDLQFTENTTSNTGNNSSGSSAPLNRHPVPTPKHVSDDFSDENSIKEQKIQALRGYQNDRLQEPFYDVNSPLNIQVNFDALRKITALNEGIGLGQEDILNQNYTIEFPCKNKPNPISSTEVTQCLVLTSSLSVDSEADSEPEFKKNVQLNNSSVSISSGELMIDSGSSDGSIGNSSAVTDNEATVCAKQDSLDTSLLKNNPEFLNPGVQVPAWTDDANVLTQNQTLEYEYKPEHIGNVGCNPTHPNRSTEAESGKESHQKVSEGGDSFDTHHEVSPNKHYFNTKENHTDLSNEDVWKYSGCIYQEPDYENEAGNDHEFEAGNSGDIGACYLEEEAIDALSNKYVASPSQQRSQTKLPEKPTRDLRQPDYVLLSTVVLFFTIVAGFAWKYYHK